MNNGSADDALTAKRITTQVEMNGVATEDIFFP
jgi:hypothetical protein